MALYVTTVSSPFGPVRLLWRRDGDAPCIARVLLPSDPFTPDGAERSHPAVDALAGLLGAYLRGKVIDLPLDLVDLDACSPFQQRVLLAEYAIPRGAVSTYGLVARHLGQPGAARAVGRALATNPFALLIPCHRAVRGDGSLGGYRGGLPMKRALLEMEGIPFGADGRVQSPFFYDVRTPTQADRSDE